MEWISIKEKLPPIEKKVLIMLPRRKIPAYGEYGEDGFWYSVELHFPFYYDICKTPTHWMPLPDPPKE